MQVAKVRKKVVILHVFPYLMHLRGSKYGLLLVGALLAFSRMMPAQTLPDLPMDRHIQKGSLGCGAAYYMVTAPSEKGYADIAIVQRDEPLSESKREALHAAFFGRMGVAPAADGFVSDVDGSTVYRFRHIPFYRPEVLDSTLLYSFSLVAASKAQQAVIVSGDIDPVELKKKMDIFSMMVPRMLVKEAHVPDYEWEPSPAPLVLLHPGAPAEVSVTYACARIPFAYMNTAQALVTDLFGLEFQVLLRHRLERNLREARVPFGQISFRSLRSADYGGDERYTVAVQVDSALLDPAMRVLSATLAEMDAFGVTPVEYAQAKQVLQPQLQERAAAPPGSEEAVSRCIAHFLYGANLAPAGERLRLFSRKNVADSTGARLFNQFSGALLEQLSNLTLEYTGVPDTLDRDQALFYYNLSYLYGSLAPSGKDYSWNPADSLALEVNCPRTRVKTEKPEALTGGTLWTFGNGMRVIYKRVPGSGTFHYALLLNGGLSRIEGLRAGEGGYMGDMLALYDAGGLSAHRFRDLLEAGGVRLESQVQLSNTTLRGEAPSARLSLLLKALLGLANNRSVNREAFARYAAGQALQAPSLEQELESRLYPGYRYTAAKDPSVLSQETQDKAEQFYDERFARMNDGVLILCGDLPEEPTKKLLGRYLGGFRTLRGGVPRRPVELQTRSGVTTHTAEGPDKGISLLLDCDYTLTADHFYTAQVAVEALRRVMLQHLAGYGYGCQLRLDFLSQPQERVRLYLRCQPLPKENMPADIHQDSAEKALTAVRAALWTAGTLPIEPVDLEAWKARLAADTQAALSHESAFVDVLLARYAHNKDLISRYPQAIAGVSEAGVRELLRLLAGGGRIEWMVP